MGRGGRGEQGSLYYFSDLQSFQLAMQDSQIFIVPIYCIVLKPGIICTFLIHSSSLQKMLTGLFSLFWNT